MAEMLGLTDLVDLVIPRGSKQLVQFVQANTRIPVLGHAEGICHIYVDDAADEALALAIIEDAKTDYPSACNTVETVLVHRGIAGGFSAAAAGADGGGAGLRCWVQPRRRSWRARELRRSPRGIRSTAI